jgi:putative transcriptional regulator
MTNGCYLKGQLLLAMPAIGDGRFHRSVIYICSHSDQGAMGLVINKASDNIDFVALLDQLNVEVHQEIGAPSTLDDVIIHEGGPVEVGRGFILHSADYAQDSTMIISETIALTATIDILKAIVESAPLRTETRPAPPHNFLIALGYASWSAGQLETEIQHNSWLTIEADEELIFWTELDAKWTRAMAKLGVDITKLSTSCGQA